MPTISPDFSDRIIAIHGQTGQNWLGTLADLQGKMALRWSLSDIHPIHDLSYNYLAFATTSNNTPVVLKLGVPHPELEAEIQALRVFNGSGSVRLLESDPSQGALLLERIFPGDNLLSIQDNQESTRIASSVMRKIWKPAPSNLNFPTATKWCQGFQRYLDKYSSDCYLSLDLIRNAANLSKDLLSSSQNQLLLHGDLHHKNILLGENKTWIAIDPQGVLGEEAFEVGALLLNPAPEIIHWPDLKEVQMRRLRVLEETLSIDRERLASWSFVRAVLSAIWSLEDGEDWRHAIKIAEILKDLI